MFSRSEPQLMKPGPEVLVSNTINDTIREIYLVYRQLLRNEEATVIYRGLANFDCDGNDGEDQNRCQ